MALTLSAFNLDTLTFTICANQGVAWQNLSRGTFGYEIDTNYPYASGCSTSTACSSVSVTWGSPFPCTSSISLTAISDTTTLSLCAYLTATPTTSAIYNFNPYHLYIQQNRINDTSLSATAWYQQVSTGNLKPINGDFIIDWSIATINTHNLTAIQPTIHYFDTHLNGTAQTISTIYLSSNSSDYLTYNLILSSPKALSISDTNIIINGPITVQQLELSTSYIKLSAIQYNLPLSPDKLLIWNIVPYTNGIESLTGNNTPTLTFNTTYSALTAGMVILSTTDLTNSYLYTLSSYTGMVSGAFRPYDYLTHNTTLSTSVITIDDSVQQHQYALDVHGIKKEVHDVIHNLPLNSYLVWKNVTTDTGIAVTKLDNTTYNFNTIEATNNIEKLNLYITPNSTTTYPRLCTYSFIVCALSGFSDNETIAMAPFNIQLQEWLDSELFNPAFTIQYEPIAVNTIYRPLTSGNYRITNDSLLPASSVGKLIYTFNDVVSTIAYNTITDVAPAEIYHNFNGLTPCICSINLTVKTSCANYSAYVIREAITKNIHFVDFPVASNFVVYPEYTWTGSDWGQVVYSAGTNSGEILSANIGLSAYSFGHVENFFVSANDVIANQYVWSVQNSLDNSVQTSTILTSPTGWLAIQAPIGTTTHSICAAFYTSALPITMPKMYFDDPIGQRYPNFSTTFETPTSIHRKHINFYGMENGALLPIIKSVETNPAGIPSNVYLTGGYNYNGGAINDTPFNYYIGAFTFVLSSNYAVVEKSANILSDSAVTKLFINVDDIGDGYLSFPKFEVSSMDIIPIINITAQLKTPHPSSNTWTFTNTHLSSYENKENLKLYPVVPTIYTPNKYTLTGIDIKFENLVECFSGIQDLTWRDRENNKIETTCVPYITSFNSEGAVDLTLTTQFSAYEGILTLTNNFKNIINIDSNYATYDPNINRLYIATELKLPYNYEDVSIGANDWLVADTFNASITKLYENLDYLQYMSQLYDVPPTEYYGWLGTLTYANSTNHFRWYVNSPNINYGYNRPDYAIDDKFTKLKDIFVRDNIMYVSNGTTVSVLSSDFRATTLGSIGYKTIGDNFTNIKAIKLDSDNRVYVLDTIDENNVLNGSKNRIIVYTFDQTTGTWSMIYGWGGLGGANAKTKFNNPNDFYIDNLNRLWVVDTGNNVVKQFTRTGSWLQTISSDLFNDDAPLSVVLDENDNIYVLTSSKIIQFSNSGVYISHKSLTNSGAKTIRPCSDEGFAYICYSDKIVKYMYSDGNEAIFANNDFVNYSENYQNVFHDEFRNLYIIANNHILKYIDKLFIISLKQDTDNKLWPLQSCFVDKNEYIQDWTINRCLNRFYDNVAIIHKSLMGKFAYKTVQTSTNITTLSTIPTPSIEEFDYCNNDFLYGSGRYVTNDVVFEYIKPTVRTFTTDEYRILPFSKDNIYIGINELVTAPVFSRVFKKLYECQLTLLEMIT